MQLLQRALALWVHRVPQSCHARNLRKRLFEQLETLRAQLRVQQGGAGDVPARPSQAGHELEPKWISNSYHHNWHTLGLLFGCDDRRSRRGHNDVRVESDQFRSELWKLLEFALCSTEVDGDVLALVVAKLSEPVVEVL